MKKFVVLFLAIFIIASCSSSKKEFRVQELEYSDYVEIVKRSDWGWLPLEKSKDEAVIKKITIHHGGVEITKDKDPIESIRNLQKWSRAEKEWIDIPYHFMIDLEGKIYEARPINYPGDTNTEYDPTGHALIEVMGNYEIQEFSEKQMVSLVTLSAFLAKKFNVGIADIKTHKDYSSKTVCPGKNIYQYFEDGTILNLIEEKMKD
jgi:N-acetylmuramoyl-L-alanine amidase